jgi:hypothetical protein
VPANQTVQIETKPQVLFRGERLAVPMASRTPRVSAVTLASSPAGSMSNDVKSPSYEPECTMTALDTAGGRAPREQPGAADVSG